MNQLGLKLARRSTGLASVISYAAFASTVAGLLSGVISGIGAAPAHAQTPGQPLTIFENVTLSPGFAPDPTTVRGISGGDRSANEIAGRSSTATGPCNGFIDTQPDHTIVLTQFFNYLSLQVQSNEDTTIIVRGPGGTWCNDDYSGKNPGIAGQWLSGTYEVWVGSFAQNSFSPYVIRISETKP
ncbi:hypothetical protein [Leptolyngbya ohadii]|uniref:hypothetical protein n=1 Tax=Leptolyngbya ohadii TaxID=1962290 RepID=UPI000B599FBE|nr:hypothetical protein [Leptolyngbya ohadii]